VRHFRVATVLLPFLAGCSVLGPRGEVVRASPAAPQPNVVYVANGAGDYRGLSSNLTMIASEARLVLDVETFEWSHGSRRVIADQVDHENQVAEANRLAALVTARRSQGAQKIFLVGHSAGTGVVLLAAERLPPDSIDRIALLAPSVCVDYDLRPALRTARHGIDVYYSQYDWFVLGLGVGMVGTADRDCRRAAGRYSFTPVVETPADATLYRQRLHQYPWELGATWAGNNGGHYGSIQPEFLREYVLPRLLSP
jgi:pimeloyl-ACP methyl ester carboxylesterase